VNSLPAKDFPLRSIPPLSRSTVDRDEWLRDATEHNREGWPKAKVLEVDRRSNVATRNGGTELVFRAARQFGETPPENAVLLGESDGIPYWAVRTESETGSTAGAWQPINSGQLSDDEQWLDLRTIGALLSDTEAGLLTTAIGLLYWHAHANFCANCGARSAASRSGWTRTCTGCGREEFPRTDAAVIVLVHDGADHVLLARQPSWPPHRYSILAGFVEAGEPLEGAVAREVHEEVGVILRDIRYLGSQPWPFPRSLMIGFAAVADRDAPLTLAEGEIEQARWVHRDEVVDALRLGADGPTESGLILAGKTSIARGMLESWCWDEFVSP
jgi:NAD+ diphosphatase